MRSMFAEGSIGRSLLVAKACRAKKGGPQNNLGSTLPCEVECDSARRLTERHIVWTCAFGPWSTKVIRYGRCKRCPLEREGYLNGAPELVGEISHASEATDLRDKKKDYEKAGVKEYIVIALKTNQVHWFVRRRGKFKALAAGAASFVPKCSLACGWTPPHCCAPTANRSCRPAPGPGQAGARGVCGEAGQEAVGMDSVISSILQWCG